LRTRLTLELQVTMQSCLNFRKCASFLDFFIHFPQHDGNESFFSLFYGDFESNAHHHKYEADHMFKDSDQGGDRGDRDDLIRDLEHTDAGSVDLS